MSIPKKIRVNITLLMLIGLSCDSRVDLSFERNKVDYANAVACLEDNYNAIFPPNEVRSSITVFDQKVRDEYNFIRCYSHLKLLLKYSVEIVSYDKDSTVSFYSKSGGGRSTQTVLVYCSSKERLDSKLDGLETLKKEYGENWYELERKVGVIY